MSDRKETYQTCENCRFWKDLKNDNSPNYGQCRKRAPIEPLVDGPDIWPWTGKSDWCGEWHSKETNALDT